MRIVSVVGLLVLGCGAGYGAEMSALKLSAKITRAEACTDVQCSTNMKMKVKASGEVTITEGEANDFNADTVVVVEGTGYQFLFRIGDDPNYTPGDTSANVKSTVNLGVGPIPTSLKVNWAGGKLGFTVSASGKALLTSPHVDSGTGAAGKGNKDHEVTPVFFNISAENSNVSFLSTQTLVYGDSRFAEIKEQDLAGTVTETQEMSVKSQSFSIVP